MTCSHLNTEYPLESFFSEPCECQLQHCGKDATTGRYPPVPWVVAYLNEEAYGEDDQELYLGACRMCVAAYLGKKKTRTKTILKVVPLVSQVHGSPRAIADICYSNLTHLAKLRKKFFFWILYICPVIPGFSVCFSRSHCLR